MIKRIVAPIILFIYCFILALIETEFGHLFVDNNGYTHNGINTFNLISIIFVALVLFIFNVMKVLNDIEKRRNKIFYMCIMVVMLSLISYFWINHLVWK